MELNIRNNIFDNSAAFNKGRKNIRCVKDIEDLSSITKSANQKEEERIRRIENIEVKFKAATIKENFKDQLILDYDFENNLPLVSVHQNLACKLKNHQKEGVKFMWTACYESLDQSKKSDGSGCILAHCMGLGKTLQVITLIHTLLSHKETETSTVLICCPKNTLLNWLNEFRQWITSDLGKINICNPTRHEDNQMRLYELSSWHINGGVCIINYELFRILLEDGKKDSRLIKLSKKFYEFLCNPGPDLVICDEGHVLKNEDTKLSKVMNQIRTLRRIVLTGTPMQNNLNEYYCMVQFVKPYLLGTRSEFSNMFINPILNGQYENSLYHDVRLMKERSHILHKKLKGCVQRFDITVLRKFMPEKREYVILVSLTNSQIEMYKFYMENYSAKGDLNWKTQTTQLFADYQSLQRIWTHPLTLKQYQDKHEKIRNKKSKKRKRKSVENGSTEEDSTDTEGFHWTRYPLFWWNRFATVDDLDDARQSNKLIVLLNILQKCEEEGEKLLVFSGSLYSLRLIEHFLKKINKTDFEEPSLCNMISSWEEGEDYLVLTGQTSAKDRDSLCKRFNNKINDRLRLFLISTKAGGMGINLIAANRAVIFDVSWNPSHDLQSIFRIYRLGQTKPCFIYRLVASGTMEETMYERQVAKQSISFRVIDEKQTARLFTKTELLELYQFEPHKEHKINISEPEDLLLQKVLKEISCVINGIYEHDSLLQHHQEEELQDVEKEDAWIAFNNNSNTSDANNSSDGNKEDTAQCTQILTPDSCDQMDMFIPDSCDQMDMFISDSCDQIDKFIPQSCDPIEIATDSDQDDMELKKEFGHMNGASTPSIKSLISKSDKKKIKSEKVLLEKKDNYTFSNSINKKPKINQASKTEENINESENSVNNLTITSISNEILLSSDSEDSFFIDSTKSTLRKKHFLKKPLISLRRRYCKHFTFFDKN